MQRERPYGSARGIAASLTSVAAVAVAALFGSTGLTQAAPVEVLVLATVHMSNPGLDLHNTQVGDVLQPELQGQIARIADGLARFRPTVVAVESSAASAREDYALYLADRLPPSRDETVQLGFRLARTAGLNIVHGIDAASVFPFPAVQAFAAAHGQLPTLDALQAEIATRAQAEQALLDREALIPVMRSINDPESIRSDHAAYRAMLRFGAGDEQPGADLLAEWYKRNLLICANIVQLTRPGDRIVVIFGSGHAFLLRQCAAETPGLKLIEANDYLPK